MGKHYIWPVGRPTGSIDPAPSTTSSLSPTRRGPNPKRPTRMAIFFGKLADRDPVGRPTWHFYSLRAKTTPLNAHNTLTRNRQIRHQKPVPVSDAPDMQFGTEFFWYQFLVTNRTCYIFVPVYGTSFWHGFLAPISSACVTGVSRNRIQRPMCLRIKH